MRGSAMGVLAAALVAFCMAGCGWKSAQPPKPAAQKSAVPLPEWAPKSPSPEFMRAAKVLKPFPLEAIQGAAQAEQGWNTMIARATRTWPAGYEFFGTLTDQEIARFQSTHDVRFPVKSLRSQQRAAMDKWLAARRTAMGGLPGEEDPLVGLYKMGAKEDLSNVAVGFDTFGPDEKSRIVHITFWVRQADGSVKPTNTAFASL